MADFSQAFWIPWLQQFIWTRCLYLDFKIACSPFFVPTMDATLSEPGMSISEANRNHGFIKHWIQLIINVISFVWLSVFDINLVLISEGYNYF